MKTSLTKLEGLKRSLMVELPVDTFNQKTDKIIENLSKQAEVDGFRKGKVPASILRQRVLELVQGQMLLNEIVSETLVEALTDADVTPAAQPSLTNVDTDNADSFIYTIEFEVYPEIKVGSLSSLSMDQVNAKVTEAR